MKIANSHLTNKNDLNILLKGKIKRKIENHYYGRTQILRKHFNRS